MRGGEFGMSRSGGNLQLFCNTGSINFNNTGNPGFFGIFEGGTRDLQITAGGVKTVHPPGGASADYLPWKLGGAVAGAAVLDATQFVEVAINGTLVKLAVIV